MRALTLIPCLVLACDAGEKPAPPAAPPAKAPWTAAVVKDADLEFLAPDTDMFVRIDLASMRQSQMWPTYKDDIARLIAPSFEGCASPFDHASSIVVGAVMTPQIVTIVVRGIERDKLRACFFAKLPNRTVTLDGDLATVEMTGRTWKDMIAFADDKTMVMQRSTQLSKVALTNALRNGAPLAQDVRFAEALKQLPPKAQVAMVSRPDSEAVRAKSTSLGVKLRYFHGTLELSDRLRLSFATVFKSADEATQLTNLMKGQLGSTQVKQMFDQIDARSDHETSWLDLDMSAAKLAAMVGIMRGMF